MLCFLLSSPCNPVSKWKTEMTCRNRMYLGACHSFSNNSYHLGLLVRAWKFWKCVEIQFICVWYDSCELLFWGMIFIFKYIGISFQHTGYLFIFCQKFRKINSFKLNNIACLGSVLRHHPCSNSIASLLSLPAKN